MISYSEISVLLHLFLFCYGLFIILLIQGWYSIKNREKTHANLSEKFSILIPFRNEAEHLPLLLSSLRAQNFSNVLEKIIFVNDHSSDNSLEIIRKHINVLPIEILELDKAHGKKEAIILGWSKIKSPWIAQLDADVVLPNTWFQKICETSKSKEFTILPLEFSCKTPVQKIFALEYMSISMMTFGSAGMGNPLMANAAHIFYINKGLENIIQTKRWKASSSGDDIAILEYFKNKSTVQASLNTGLSVSTSSEKNLKSIFQQRLRWASKTSSNSSLKSQAIALFMVFANILYLVSIIKVIVQATELPVPIFHIFFFGKLFLDLIFLLPALVFFNKARWIVFYPILAIFYPFYVLLIVIFSFWKKGNWKGRPIKIN